MNRNNIERFDENVSKSLENHQKNKKTRIEKGIVTGAVMIILIALLVIPKYEAYQENKMMLAEKVEYNLELPDEMTEETYLKQLKIIAGQLNETRNNLPESLDTVSLYETVAKMAESAKVGLTSLEFGSMEIEIDDQLGKRIDEGFIENQEKTIIGPDGKFLTVCEFTVICTGNDQTFMAFLDELNKCSPIIQVISYQISNSSEGEKRMRLKLQSYGVLEDSQEKVLNP